MSTKTKRPNAPPVAWGDLPVNFVQISPSWGISQTHETSRGGVPVLVDKRTGAAFGPTDLVQLAPDAEPLPAREAVRNWWERTLLVDRQSRLAQHFIEGKL